MLGVGGFDTLLDTCIRKVWGRGGLNNSSNNNQHKGLQCDLEHAQHKVTINLTGWFFLHFSVS